MCRNYIHSLYVHDMSILALKDRSLLAFQVPVCPSWVWRNSCLSLRSLHSILRSHPRHSAGEHPWFSQQTCKSHYISYQMKQHKCCLPVSSTHNLQEQLHHQDQMHEPIGKSMQAALHFFLNLSSFFWKIKISQHHTADGGCTITDQVLGLCS